MSWELFWAYKDSVEELGGTGFSIFSLPHLLWILFCLTVIICITLFYRCSGDHQRDNMRKSIALFLILFEITKQCAGALTGAPSAKLLPLHLCSFAEYAILIDALWPQNRFFKQLMAFPFLPSAVIAFLLPTVISYPPLNFYAIHQFLLHAVITAYIIARYSAGEIKPRYAGLWLSLLVTAFLAALIYPINCAFQTNFMFLARYSDNPVLKLIWDMTGGTGGIAYILGLGIIVAIVFHLLFVLYAVLKRTTNKKALNTSLL